MAKKKASKKPAAKKKPAKVAPSAAGELVVPEYTYEDDVPLERLYQDPANARVHGDRNMQAIVSSLRSFGQVEALVVQKSSGQIIGGNGRFDAMRQLGWKAARVAWVDCTDLQATKLGLMLNRTGDLAETNEDVLATLLGKLQDAGEDVSGGWSDEELAEMNADVEVPDEEPDATIEEQFMVLVTCRDEAEQTELLERFESEGLQVKAMVS